MYSLRPTAVLILALILAPVAHSQSSEHEGVRLYKIGRASEAQAVLAAAVKTDAYKSNADMWNYLGLAHLESKDNKAARKAFEKAIGLNKTRSDFFINLAYAHLMMRQIDKAQDAAKAAIAIAPASTGAYYLMGTANLWEGKLDEAQADAEKAVQVDPGFAQGYALQADVKVARLGELLQKDPEATVHDNLVLLREARDILRTGMEKTTAASPNRKLIENESAAMEAFYDFFTKDRPRPSGTPEPGVTPLNVIKKRPARYTDQARQAGVKGSIRMAILFGASGRIEHKLILKGLGYGLDQQALAAANEIVFEPQKKDGVPVSTVRLVEYTFSIY